MPHIHNSEYNQYKTYYKEWKAIQSLAVVDMNRKLRDKPYNLKGIKQQEADLIDKFLSSY